MMPCKTSFLKAQRHPPEVFYKKAVFKGKHLCWSLFLIKLQVFRPKLETPRDSNIGVFL